MPDRARDEDKQFSELYWRGKADPVTWGELQRWASEGYRFHGKRVTSDVALFPALSGLVIIDCDVKEYREDTGSTVPGFTQLPDGSVRLAPMVTRYGLDDLTREVEKLGHSTAELATYAVESKSGGVHLYFHANPGVKLHTTGHKDNWRVDVVAHNTKGDRNWVAAPPTAEYHVIRDLPVAEMPTWLAKFLRDTVSRWPKPGGERRRVADEARKRARVSYERAVTADGRRDYFREWIGHELHEVELANECGGWNDALNKCAWVLFKEAELPFETGKSLLLKAAAPWTDAEERKATDTIRSAWCSARPGDYSYLED